MPRFDLQAIEVPRDGCLSVRKKFYDGQVAARSPGPGAHELEGYFGSGRKNENKSSRKVEAPSYSLGARKWPGADPWAVKTATNPGPGKYDTNNKKATGFGVQTNSTKRSNKGQVFGTSTRPPLLDTGYDTPGAKYKLDGTEFNGKQVLSKKNNFGRPVFGNSVRPPLLDEGHDSPGPAAHYRYEMAAGKQNSSKKRSNPAWGFGQTTSKQRPYLQPQGHDSPAAKYKFIPAHGKQVNSKKRSYGSATFGTAVARPYLQAQGHDTPGPIYPINGSMSKQSMSTKRSNPSFSLGSR